MAETKVSVNELGEAFNNAETITGRIWYDGRPIYRKVLTGTLNVTLTGSGTLTHSISGLTSSCMLTSVGGSIKLGATQTTGTVNLLPVYHESSNLFAINGMTSTNINWASTFAWGNSYYEISLEYVK